MYLYAGIYMSVFPAEARDAGYSGAGVRQLCAARHGCWDLNYGPLKEQ